MDPAERKVNEKNSVKNRSSEQLALGTMSQNQDRSVSTFLNATNKWIYNIVMDFVIDRVKSSPPSKSDGASSSRLNATTAWIVTDRLPSGFDSSEVASSSRLNATTDWIVTDRLPSGFDSSEIASSSRLNATNDWIVTDRLPSEFDSSEVVTSSTSFSENEDRSNPRPFSSVLQRPRPDTLAPFSVSASMDKNETKSSTSAGFVSSEVVTSLKSSSKNAKIEKEAKMDISESLPSTSTVHFNTCNIITSSSSSADKIIRSETCTTPRSPTSYESQLDIAASFDKIKDSPAFETPREFSSLFRQQRSDTPATFSSNASGQKNKKCAFYEIKEDEDGKPIFNKKLLNYIFKIDTPEMEDLKKKRYNTSFLHQTPIPNREIKIFPEEEDNDPKYFENMPTYEDSNLPEVPGSLHSEVFKSLPDEDLKVVFDDDLLGVFNDDEPKDDEPNVNLQKGRKRRSTRIKGFEGKPLPEHCLSFNYSSMLRSHSNIKETEVLRKKYGDILGNKHIRIVVKKLTDDDIKQHCKKDVLTEPPRKKGKIPRKMPRIRLAKGKRGRKPLSKK